MRGAPIMIWAALTDEKIRVDQQGIVYLTFQCVGYAPGPTVNGQFRLDTAKALSKTMVATSVDRGSTWSTLGFFSLPGQYNGWRQDIVAASNQMVLLAQGLALRVGYSGPTGQPLNTCGWQADSHKRFLGVRQLSE